ncbi:hypothetical protein HispidOSU_013682, partial [Sigmodon hispidus]
VLEWNREDEKEKMVLAKVTSATGSQTPACKPLSQQPHSLSLTAQEELNVGVGKENGMTLTDLPAAKAALRI